MTEINKEGMAIAPGVVETIVSLAVREVPGVAAVGTSAPASGIRSLFTQKQTASGVSVYETVEGTLDIVVNITVVSGFSLSEIVAAVRSAVSDAVISQVGLAVSRVDVCVDAIQFRD